MSSDTNLPALTMLLISFIKFLSKLAEVQPFKILRISSPVEMWFNFKSFFKNLAQVPLPTPGAPNIIINFYFGAAAKAYFDKKWRLFLTTKNELVLNILKLFIYIIFIFFFFLYLLLNYLLFYLFISFFLFYLLIYYFFFCFGDSLFRFFFFI